MKNENVQNPPVESTEVIKEVVSPTPVAEENKKEESDKSKSKVLIPIVIVLTILLLGIGGYIVYTQYFNKANKVVDTNEDEITTEDEEDIEEIDVCNVGDDCNEEITTEDETTEFVGQVISATLPAGWNIVEYFDGAGTESLPDMTEYFGLTAFDILNPENLQVFTLQAVSGIGFAGCPEYPLFNDNGENYMAMQESASTEMGETLNVVDYTNEEYIEFEFLNTTFRRIANQYFYDTQEGHNYFEPPCVDGLLTLEGL